jgi:hypothetical protein
VVLGTTGIAEVRPSPLPSACGPERPFAIARSCPADRASRARGRPPVAHAGSVAAARRLRWPCRPRLPSRAGRSQGAGDPLDRPRPGSPARPGLARHNSLRELRSLRSDTCRESDGEARAARAPRPGLRCSPPQKSPPAGAPWRDGHRGWRSQRQPPPVPQRTVRAAGRAHMQRRAPQGSWPRAQRASPSDSPHVFERSERSSRSELCGGPRDRGAQGSLRRRRRPRNLSAAGCPCGPLPARTHERRSGRRTAAQGRLRPPARPVFQASRVAPCAVEQPR